MRHFGYSTGALAKGNVRKAVAMLQHQPTEALELSALRMEELPQVLRYLSEEGVGPFDYVSFHAPSAFSASDEPVLAEAMRKVADEFGATIVMHPDAICDFALWRPFGRKLALENMDHRKPIGRTANELESLFQELPDAGLCFDIGHAHEIDRSMSQAYEILFRHRHRIVQLHASEVTDDCVHRPFSASSRAAFGQMSGLIPESAPVILEAITSEDDLAEQLKQAREIFQSEPVLA